ncbi:MAG: threonylcarbamoyl-AMP synthase [Oligoflexales bacterium]|nr:threonylcarbamoyl-AMP synthase [Oligoflexales bacterium]
MSNQTFETQCLPCTDEALSLGEALLRQGEIIGVPTETVYGLAADASNGEAIEKIYIAKGRPSFNPLIVHVGSSLNSCQKLAEQGLLDRDKISEQAVELANKLMRAFWPGPLTLVLPRGPTLSPMVARGLETVGFRMPGHPDFLKFLDRSGLVLAAPSANRSNRISPTLVQHVLAELSGRIPLVLDGGACQVGLESTIVEISGPSATIRLLRKGAIACEALEAEAGVSLQALPAGERLLAPGMMSKHYSPTKPLLLVHEDNLCLELQSLRQSGVLAKISVLKFSDSPSLTMEKELQICGSPLELKYLPCNDSLAAKILFQTLRMCDESDAQIILVELPKQRLQSGLWPAIWDRLTRAGVRHLTDRPSDGST